MILITDNNNRTHKEIQHKAFSHISIFKYHTEDKYNSDSIFNKNN